MVEDPAVGDRLGVVELVDDDDLERIGRDVGDAVGGQGLHGREHVLPALRPGAPDVELAEVRVTEHLAIGATGLLQDLLAMRHEEQARTAAGLLGQALVVEGGDDRLAGASRGDEQVAVPVVHHPLDLELLEHLRLVRVGPHLQAGQREGDPIMGLRASRLRQRVVEPVTVALGVVGLERRVVPVGVEGGAELLEQRRRAHRREAHVPLHAVEQRGAREVARPDVCRVEAGVAPEQPRLGVKTGAQRVVLHLDVGAEVGDQTVKGGPLGGAHVGRGDQAQRDATVAELGELLLQQAQAVPLHERQDDVHLVSAGELSSQLCTDAGLALGIGQQRSLRERRRRSAQ